MKIGVSGASGQLGQAVIKELGRRAAGHQLVAITRSPETASKSAEGRLGDYDRPETLAAAYADLDRLLIIPGPELRPGVRSAQAVAAVDAAVAAGVGHVFLLSATGTRKKAEPAMGAAYWAAEDRLVRSDVAAWTILRMNYFAETLVQEAQMAGATGMLPGFAENRVAYVGRDDVAAACAGAMATDGHVGATYNLSGPAAVTGAERAALLSEAGGKPLRFAVIGEDQLRAGLAQAGMPAFIGDALASMQSAFADGAYDIVTGDIEKLAGRPPRPLREVLTQAYAATTDQEGGDMTDQPAPIAAPAPGSPVEGMQGFMHRYADVNGTRIHYVVGGAGPAIVLLHGFPYTWAEWGPIMPGLAAAGFTVLAPDLRGMGDSALADDGYDKVNVAQDVREIVRHLGLGPIDLVGADIGTMVAYAYASRHPDEVAHLVLAESLLPGFGLEELMNPATGGFWHFGFHMQVDLATFLTQGKEAAYLLPSYKMMSASPDAEAYAAATYLPHYTGPQGLRGAFQHYGPLAEDGKANLADFKDKLPMPVLVLNGDAGIPQEPLLAGARQVAARVEADIVPGSAHTLAHDNPLWVTDRLIRFFARPNGGQS